MKMRIFSAVLVLWFSWSTSPIKAATYLREKVYVDTEVDSDKDGKSDKIFVSVSRPSDEEKMPSIYSVNPYSSINSNAPFHNVDVLYLPQDVLIHRIFGMDFLSWINRKKFLSLEDSFIAGHGYAYVEAHSLGTGKSDGCPTIGDPVEANAAKAVIDWLNGRAKAHDESGKEVKATWSNGLVGMTGISYLGTLPNMVAALGVSELKAIVPIAAISSWYDYYRANGLVVGPGGYIGEDIDSLAQFITQRDSCKNKIQELTSFMGRETGDYTDFWKSRDMRIHADRVDTAVFVIHGQSDWNVKQSHAVEWWKLLQGKVPARLWLHNGGHESASNIDQEGAITRWFDRYVKGIHNGVDEEPSIMVQSRDGVWRSQVQWPHEESHSFVLFPHGNEHLENFPPEEIADVMLVDRGRTDRLESMLENNRDSSLLKFQSKPFQENLLLSGTSYVHLEMALLNRHAANISAALVDIDPKGRKRIITRGWADPQNHKSLEVGVVTKKAEFVKLEFKLEPKQYLFSAGHRLAVVLYSTDYDYTLRPREGSEVVIRLGRNTFFELNKL